MKLLNKEIRFSSYYYQRYCTFVVGITSLGLCSNKSISNVTCIYESFMIKQNDLGTLTGLAQALNMSKQHVACTDNASSSTIYHLLLSLTQIQICDEAF